LPLLNLVQEVWFIGSNITHSGMSANTMYIIYKSDGKYINMAMRQSMRIRVELETVPETGLLVKFHVK